MTLLTNEELEIQVYDTIAIQGQNVKRAFQQLARDAVLNYYNKIKNQ